MDNSIFEYRDGELKPISLFPGEGTLDIEKWYKENGYSRSFNQFGCEIWSHRDYITFLLMPSPDYSWIPIIKCVGLESLAGALRKYFNPILEMSLMEWVGELSGDIENFLKRSKDERG